MSDLVTVQLSARQFAILSRSACIGLAMVGGGTSTTYESIVQLRDLIVANPNDLADLKHKMAAACENAMKILSA